MNENTLYGLQEVIKFKMEVIADMIGTTPGAITKITGWGNDTVMYHNLHKVIKTVKMGNLEMEDLKDILYSLNKIQQEWEVKGF